MPRPSRWLPYDPRGIVEPYPVTGHEHRSFGYSPVRTPWLAAAIGACIAIGALALLAMTVVHLALGTGGVTPWLLAPLLLALAGGIWGVAIGVVRHRWLRRWRQATGQRYPDRTLPERGQPDRR